MSEWVPIDLDLDLSPFTLYLNGQPKGGLPAEVVVKAGTSELELRCGKEVVSTWTVDTPGRVKQQVVLPLESGSVDTANKARKRANLVPGFIAGAGKTALIIFFGLALFSAVPFFVGELTALLWLLFLPVIGATVFGILGKKRRGMKLWALCFVVYLVSALIINYQIMVLMILGTMYLTVYMYNQERGEWT